MGVLTEKKYRIHYYEIDWKQRILPTALVNYFQDVAIMQSESLGVGINYLKENNLAWPLYQWDISLEKYPELGQEINVSTRPCFFEKCNAYREFQAKDENGAVIASAFSRWALIDTGKLKLTRIPEKMYQVYGLEPNEEKPQKMGKPEEVSKIDYKSDFTVKYYDLDTNKHLNNAKYIEWAINTLPREIFLEYSLVEAKVLYKKEARLGDPVQILTEIKDDHDKLKVLHKILDKDERTLCLLENYWK